MGNPASKAKVIERLTVETTALHFYHAIESTMQLNLLCN